MNPELARLVSEHWPTMTVVIAFLVGVYFIVKAMALTFDAIGDALGPIGKAWRAKKNITQGEAEDMRRRLQYLAEQVRALRHRDEIYFAYVLTDEEWHRRHELLAISNGWILAPHVGFREFSEKWLNDRGLEKELDLWL